MNTNRLNEEVSTKRCLKLKREAAAHRRVNQTTKLTERCKQQCIESRVHISMLTQIAVSKAQICPFDLILAFTSMEAKINKNITGTRSIYTFCIHGEIYHQIGSLLSQPATASLEFAQIYIFDTDHETQNRHSLIFFLDITTLTVLQQTPSQNLSMVIKDSRTTDPHHYNIPNASEIVAIIVDNESDETTIHNRDIVLHSCSENLIHISELHRAYAPLYYVLLFSRDIEELQDLNEISNSNNQTHDNECLGKVIECGAITKTTLTAWFEANQKFSEAHQLTYASECYYLRMLLNIVHSATSFENLWNVNEVDYDTFKDACEALGLLHNDRE
ncbi:22278_t:CDS:2 [Cetraspora pellucida]|uniref:22278_t:CDS:1 n=1 Tax=Cetraspora pellucida TaxID=1433469 RepID=A0A9N8ZS01_9GLOM|nr:22278_t:CDS:2 [Cetraspora pellucida]